MNLKALRSITIGLFFIGSLYILFVKTPKYQSEAIVMVKNLSSKPSVSMFGAMLLGSGGGGSMQDAKLLELYLRSYEMYQQLDATFKLTHYYTSATIDAMQRLSKEALIPWYRANPMHLLQRYNNDLFILYDEPSGTLKIAFQHAKVKEAQRIVSALITKATQSLNRFEKENASVALQALLSQERENKEAFIASLQKLIAYQNKHHTIDPNIDVQTKSHILATLESELIQNEVQYKSKQSYLSIHSTELQLLAQTIKELKHTIEKIKNSLAGGGENELNRHVSAFELLKSEVEFNKTRYTQTLIQLESTKMEVKQNAKNLIVVTHPTLPQSYSEPNTLKDILSLLIILSFLYGILSLVLTILNEHKD